MIIMKTIIVTGLPGCGKTSVLNEALEVLKREESKVNCVNFGDVMLESAGVKHRDELRKMPQDKQVEIQKKAAEKIAAMAKKETIFVDTHCTIRTPSGYLAGLPEWVLRALKPNAIVLIEADPAEIAKRRETDSTRNRDDETKDEIAVHQEINRAAAISYCILTGSTTKIIKNRQNKLLDAVKELVSLVK